MLRYTVSLGTSSRLQRCSLPSRLLLFIIVQLLSAFVSMAVKCLPEDMGTKQIATYQLMAARGYYKVNIFCGDDSAEVAVRTALVKDYGTEDASELMYLVGELQKAMDKQVPKYKPPEMIDAGKATERKRKLPSAGLYRRRAKEHMKQHEYQAAAADTIRGVSFPGASANEQDKLQRLMQEALTKACKQVDAMGSMDDIRELYAALELEDKEDDFGSIDEKKLKKVYRELSIRYHPDKQGGSEERFNKIREAYEIIGNPVKSLLYDTGGMELLKKWEKGDVDVERSEHEEHEFEISLLDSYLGKVIDFPQNRQVVCRSCRLHKDFSRCHTCDMCPSSSQMMEMCDEFGRCFMSEDQVESNEKCRYEERDVAINVERGTRPGERLTLEGEGSQVPMQVPGNLVITFKIIEHPLFRLRGSDLAITTKVTLYEALLGFERKLTHLDGHTVKFSVPQGKVLSPGFVLEIDDEGMPKREDPNSFGKLLVHFQIDFPKTIPAEVAGDLKAVLERIPGQKALTPVISPLPKKKSLRTEL